MASTLKAYDTYLRERWVIERRVIELIAFQEEGDRDPWLDAPLTAEEAEAFSNLNTYVDSSTSPDPCASLLALLPLLT